MKKNKAACILFLVVLAGIFSSEQLLAQTIGEIKIEGNSTVSQKKIQKVITLYEGQEYNARKVSADISAIYEMGNFRDVSVFQEQISTGVIRVIYRVRENPVIRKILFKGNEHIGKGRLESQIDTKKGDFFDDYKMSTDTGKIEDYYKEKGFAECSVEAFLDEKQGDTEADIVFYVNEGNKVEIAEFTLTGVGKENNRKARKTVKTKKGKIYKQAQLEEDIENLRKYYKNSGYLKSSVNEPQITYDQDRLYMFININIEENEKYAVDKIDFKGNLNIPDSALRESLKVKPGDFYSEEKIENDIMSVQEKYGNRGYIRMAAYPEFMINDEEGLVSVMINIVEGPIIYVRKIFIDGNNITKDYVIRRNIKVREGEPFNLQKVRESQGNIYKLGFFRDIRLEMLPVGNTDQTDIVFMVEEDKTGMASIGAGYSSQDKIVGNMRITQSNLLGRGQNLSLLWEFGERLQNYSLEFSEPYLFRTPTPFYVSIYNTKQRRRYYETYDYSEQRRGGGLTLGRHFTDEFTTYAKYSVERVKIYEIEAAINDEVQESDSLTCSLTPSLSYDTRDYPFDPSKGYLLKLSNQIAGGIFGGDHDFNKTDFRATYFQRIIWKFVAAVNLNAGVVSTYGDTEEVPLYEKFHVGGAESVRGYEYWGDIGPVEGGNYKFVTNAELKFPIVSEKGQTVLQGALFYDIGGSWKYRGQISAEAGPGQTNLKRGYGFGIRFKVIAFPIRLDWGSGIDKDDKSFQWYFTLGDMF